MTESSNGWKCVTEVLPYPGERVIATCGGFTGEAYLKKDRITWVRNERDWNWCFEDPVTHWMFLPDPPNTE